MKRRLQIKLLTQSRPNNNEIEQAENVYELYLRLQTSSSVLTDILKEETKQLTQGFYSLFFLDSQENMFFYSLLFLIPKKTCFVFSSFLDPQENMFFYSLLFLIPKKTCFLFSSYLGPQENVFFILFFS
jgi:hypothetical protein